MAKSKLQTFKKTVWSNFSKYIRRKEQTQAGQHICVSCGRPINGAVHAGHYIAKGTGVHEAVRFDERNVHCQCYYCNNMLEGNTAHYHTWMLKKYGQPVIDDLLRLSKMKIRWSLDTLEWINTRSKENLKLLEKGLDTHPITWYTLDRSSSFIMCSKKCERALQCYRALRTPEFEQVYKNFGCNDANKWAWYMECKTKKKFDSLEKKF